MHCGEPFILAEATAGIGQAVLTAAATTGPSTVHLVGSSLGGMLASLTVCGSAVQPAPAAARLHGLGITAMSGFPTLPGRRSRSGGPPEAVGSAMTAVGALDLRDDLRRIDAPVAILSPRFDPLRGTSARSRAKSPRGSVVALGDGNRRVNLIRPERFTQDLLGILAASRPSSGRPA